MNQCENVFLRHAYNLSAYSEVNYCTTNKEERPIDALDASFLAMIIVVCLLVLCGTLYDLKLKKREDHYQRSELMDEVSVKAQIVLSFSLPRNWYRLKSQPTSEESRLLRYIQGFRFLTIYLVVWGHVLIGYILGYILNPYTFEEFFYSLDAQLQLNGFSVVQAFFSISGLLMGYQFAEMTGKRKYNGMYFWIALIYRYLRLTPVYFFVMMFDATWLYKMEDGPAWKRLAETERYNCRTNMWTNLLYINNYVNVQDGVSWRPF